MLKCGDKIIDPTIFPDGTSQVWQDRVDLKSPDVWWWFQSEDEFMHLAQFVYLRRQIGQPVKRLLVPFLPYARQHHGVEGAFALFPFSGFLQVMQIREVVTLDLHHQYGYLMGIVDRSPRPFIDEALVQSGADLILYPDEGASRRYSIYGKPTIVCEKQRDPKTGKIKGLSTSFESARRFDGASILIVDDIVDGGATFVRAAELAYAYGASDVQLYATHGIFSKGIAPLRSAGISEVYTTNSLPLDQYLLRGVTVFNVTEVMKGTIVV